MNLRDVAAALEAHPILEHLSIYHFFQFMRLCCLAKPAIYVYQRDISHPPLELPSDVLTILSHAIPVVADSHQNIALISACWDAFKMAVWCYGEIIADEKEMNLFNTHALPFNICK